MNKLLILFYLGIIAGYNLNYKEESKEVNFLHTKKTHGYFTFRRMESSMQTDSYFNIINR